jgi:hypothetical protein
MRTSQFGRLVAAALLAVLALTGCRPADESGVAGSDTSSAAADPRAVLVAAVPDRGTETYRLKVEGDVPLTGIVDPAAKKIQLATSFREPGAGFTMNMSFLVAEARSWVKISFTDAEGVSGLPRLPKTWMLLDPDKVDAADAPLRYEGADPAATRPLVDAIVDVAPDGPGAYRGTVDVTVVAGDVVEPDVLKTMGDKAKAVPFEAKLDGEGRLTSLVLDLAAAGATSAGRYAVTFSDYGRAPHLADPSDKQSKPAPPVVYEMLAG